MRKTAIVACLALAMVAGCGKKSVLKPAAGEAMPVKPATAAGAPGVNDLLALSPQAKPVRDDELVVKSTPLKPDRFDLPPPG
jgi:hypothetical protein